LRKSLDRELKKSEQIAADLVGLDKCLKHDIRHRQTPSPFCTGRVR
jgi:hypothetical protein